MKYIFDNYPMPQLYNIDFDFKFRMLDDKIVLSDDSFRNESGSYMGRFRQKQSGKYYNYSVQRANKHEMDYISKNYSDLSLTYGEYENVIAVNNASRIKNNTVIPIDNIYLTSNNFGLNTMYKDNDGRFKLISPTFTHNLGLSYLKENSIVNVIHYLNTTREILPYKFSTNRTKNFNFIPRIEYKNIIISKKTWKFDFCNAASKNNDEIQKELGSYFKKYNVDKYVCILKNGDEFPINIEKQNSIDIIIQHIKKRDSISLVEFLDFQEKNDTYDDEYVSEYIIQVCPKGQYFPDICPEDYLEYYEKINYKYNTYILETNPKINAVMLERIQQDFIKYKGKYFLLRYSDNGSSIRFRISSEVDRDDVEMILNNYIEKNLIISYSKSLYVPEYTRYGIDKMDTAEELFCLESSYDYNDLYKKSPKPELYFAIALVINFTKCMYSDWNEGMNFLEHISYGVTNDKEYKTEFKKNRELIRKNVSGILNMLENDESFKAYSKKTEIILTDIKNSYQKYSHDRQYYIYGSLLHMRINRLSLYRPINESKVNSFARAYFYNNRQIEYKNNEGLLL